MKNFPKILRERLIPPFATGWLFAIGMVRGDFITSIVGAALFMLMLLCDIWDIWKDLE